MNKAERLFQLVTLLRARRTVITAGQIAQQMGVSERTVYRDVQSLVLSGVAIEGEAGVGYRLRAGAHLPPLMFDADEVLALIVGTHMVRAFTDPALAEAANSSATKIRSILNEAQKKRAEEQPYRIPVLEKEEPIRDIHGLLRDACEARKKVQLCYRDVNDQESLRIIWPLGIVGFFGRWLLLAWCESREDYRNFRMDRIESLTPTDTHFSLSKDICAEWYFENVIGIADPAKD